MEKVDFATGMQKLAVVFAPVSKSNEDLKELAETYMPYFINMDAAIFGKAIGLLIEIHPHKEFPTVVEINAAIAEIKSSMPKQQRYGEECPKCLSMGLYIDEEDNLAKACSCSIGRTRRANLAAHDKKYGYFKAYRNFPSPIEGLEDTAEAIKEIKKLREGEPW